MLLTDKAGGGSILLFISALYGYIYIFMSLILRQEALYYYIVICLSLCII